MINVGFFFFFRSSEQVNGNGTDKNEGEGNEKTEERFVKSINVIED